MRCEPTLRLGRTRPVDVRSSSWGTLSPIRFSAAYTIDTLEYSFRKRHRKPFLPDIQCIDDYVVCLRHVFAKKSFDDRARSRLILPR
jgi:hypothetical protein